MTDRLYLLQISEKRREETIFFLNARDDVANWIELGLTDSFLLISSQSALELGRALRLFFQRNGAINGQEQKPRLFITEVPGNIDGYIPRAVWQFIKDFRGFHSRKPDDDEPTFEQLTKNIQKRLNP